MHQLADLDSLCPSQDSRYTRSNSSEFDGFSEAQSSEYKSRFSDLQAC